MVGEQRVRQSFYVWLALLLALCAMVGFGQTIGDVLIHPPQPAPAIVYVHALVFSLWILLFVAQTVLVRSNHVAWHRRLGKFGVVLGALIPVLGLATAYVSQLRVTNHVFFAVSINDMVLFTLAFWAGVAYRRKPALHRRLMLVASCVLMGAAFARFPIVPDIAWAYGCADGLIVMGIVHDWLTDRQVHRSYLVSLPVVVAGQSLAIFLLTQPPVWWITGLGIIFHQSGSGT